LWSSILASSCARTTTRRALSVNLSNILAPEPAIRDAARGRR
jgi:hypothetical protein